MELKKIFCIDYLPFKVTPLYRQISRTLASKLAITKKPASAGFFVWSLNCCEKRTRKKDLKKLFCGEEAERRERTLARAGRTAGSKP